MKNLIFFCILVIFINSKIYAQCKDCGYKSDEIWLSIDNDIGFQQNKGLLKANDKIIDDAMIKFEANQFEQVFPASKIERLKKIYKVKFNGNRDSFIDELQNSKSITRVIKRPIENQVAVYEPNDYMWYLPTQQDPNGWLWHLKRIQAAQAWDITHGSANVKIASIDTWFDVNHPDLTNKISPKYDPYDNTAYNSSCTPNGHGTVVASFIAAETDGGGQLASIGFNCMLICYQAWDGSYIERAHHASLTMDVDVITSSAGGWTCTSSIDDDERIALQEILDNGTIVVMPAGNGPTGTNCNYGGRDHPWKPLSPDYDERVIIVSSTGIDDKHYYFNPDRVINGVTTPREETHSHYPEVDICAPGYRTMGATCTTTWDSNSNSCLTNTWPYSGWSTGTSFATPIVAGVCGLMKSINPCITPSEAQSIIKSTADPVFDENLYSGLLGAGRVNAFNAVKMAGTRKYINTTLSGTQLSSAGFGFNLTNVTIGNSSNIALTARKEVNINGTFEVPLGSTFEVIMNSTAQNNCQ